MRDILGDPPEGNESYGHISDSSTDGEEYLPDSEIHKRRSQVERLLFSKTGEFSSNVSPQNTLLYVPRHSDEINISTADDPLPSETLVSASPSGGWGLVLICHTWGVLYKPTEVERGDVKVRGNVILLKQSAIRDKSKLTRKESVSNSGKSKRTVE